MARRVHAQEAVAEAALELGLERGDVVRGGARREVDEVLDGEPGAGRARGEVAAQAARVVGQRRGGLGQAVHGRGHGTEVGDGVLEGSAGDATAALAGLEPADGRLGAVVGEVGAVAAHARLASVKQGTLAQVVLVGEPVPVLSEASNVSVR